MANVKNFVLGIGIVIVFALALWQGIEAFYPSPQWDDFCGEVQPRPVSLDGVPEKESYNEFKECQDKYDLVRDSYANVVFVVSLIVALITLIVGYKILSLEPVGSALMGSGVWAIFWGTLVNWRNFSDVWRFLLLLIALVLLIWIAYRLNTKNRKGFWAKLGFKK